MPLVLPGSIPNVGLEEQAASGETISSGILRGFELGTALANKVGSFAKQERQFQLEQDELRSRRAAARREAALGSAALAEEAVGGGGEVSQALGRSAQRRTGGKAAGGAGFSVGGKPVSDLEILATVGADSPLTDSGTVAAELEAQAVVHDQLENEYDQAVEEQNIAQERLRKLQQQKQELEDEQAFWSDMSTPAEQSRALAKTNEINDRLRRIQDFIATKSIKKRQLTDEAEMLEDADPRQRIEALRRPVAERITSAPPGFDDLPSKYIQEDPLADAFKRLAEKKRERQAIIDQAARTPGPRELFDGPDEIMQQQEERSFQETARRIGMEQVSVPDAARAPEDRGEDEAAQLQGAIDALQGKLSAQEEEVNLAKMAELAAARRAEASIQLGRKGDFNPAVEFGLDSRTQLNPAAVQRAVSIYQQTGDDTALRQVGRGTVPRDLDTLVPRIREFNDRVRRTQRSRSEQDARAVVEYMQRESGQKSLSKIPLEDVDATTALVMSMVPGIEKDQAKAQAESLVKSGATLDQAIKVLRPGGAFYLQQERNKGRLEAADAVTDRKKEFQTDSQKFREEQARLDRELKRELAEFKVGSGGTRALIGLLKAKAELVWALPKKERHEVTKNALDAIDDAITKAKAADIPALKKAKKAFPGGGGEKPAAGPLDLTPLKGKVEYRNGRYYYQGKVVSEDWVRRQIKARGK